MQSQFDKILEFAVANPAGWDRWHITALLGVGYDRVSVLLRELVAGGRLQTKRCDRPGKRSIYALPGVELTG